MDLTSIISKDGGTITAIAMFIWYLVQKQKMDNKVTSDFTNTINNYLRDSVKVKQELATRLQEFSDATRENKEVIKELKDVTHDLYGELVKKTKIIRNIKTKTTVETN